MVVVVESRENMDLTCRSSRMKILIVCLAYIPLTSALICPYIDKNCYCGMQDVTCTNLTEIPSLMSGPNVVVINKAFFLSGNITTLANNSFPPGLTSITFTNHPLTDISDDAFESVNATLSKLSIANARFTRLPDALLINLTNLASLSIAYTPIEEWDNDIIENLAINLRVVYLNKVGLSAWPSWFSLFHSLSTIDLSYNSLGAISDDAFISSNDTLTHLGLRSCELITVPKALSELRILTYLDLSDNNIIEADGRPGIEQLTLFPCADTLEQLLIESSRLKGIPHLLNIRHLKTIDLDSNQISDSTSGSFPPSIEKISLDDNNLTSIPSVIANLPALSVLTLPYNQITEASFDKFPLHLKSLDLSKNKITNITEALSANISSLETLNLGTNPISTISPSAFTNLGFLKNLYLDETNLTELPLALTSLTELSTVSMLNTPSLTCPYPPPPELVRWFYSFPFGVDIIGTCNSGLGISEYVRDLSHTTLSSTTTDSAQNNEWSLYCKYACLMILLILRIL